jgi:hypothetical protein
MFETMIRTGIISALIVITLFSVKHLEKDYNQNKNIYYDCKNKSTGLYLRPLTVYKYKILEKSFDDFQAQFDCKKNKYTKFYINLFK